MKNRRTRQHDQCLGEKAAALTDGELGTGARDAALAHLVNCDDCRDDVAGQRRLKARLGDLVEPLPPAGLLERLAAMSPPDHDLPVEQVAARRHRVRLPGRADRTLSRPARSARVDHLRPYGRSHRRVRYAIGGGVSVLALGVSAFALGGGQASPTLVPSGGSFTVEQASTTGEIPFGTVPPSVTFRPVLVGARP